LPELVPLLAVARVDDDLVDALLPGVVKATLIASNLASLAQHPELDRKGKKHNQLRSRTTTVKDNNNDNNNKNNNNNNILFF
jgi:hypothetical protein